MGTIAEKILSNHVGKEGHGRRHRGCPVDFMMSQDGTTPLTIKAFKEMDGQEGGQDPTATPSSSTTTPPRRWKAVSNLHKQMRELRQEAGLDALRRGRGRLPRPGPGAGLCPARERHHRRGLAHHAPMER